MLPVPFPLLYWPLQKGWTQSLSLSVLVSRLRLLQSKRLMLHSSNAILRLLQHARPQSFQKSSVWPSQDSCPWQYDSSSLSSPHAIWPLNIRNSLKSMSGFAFNDTQVVYHHMNCALWCTLLWLILHQHFACLTWWMCASALSHFLCASWSCSLQSALLQSLLFAVLLSIHPCIMTHFLL